nr:GT-D fold domain-containing glycosyltransferase [uncultured Methanobrevibacter sp.]
MALGPTATVLSYDLAEEGYYALDIGHLDIEYEWFLRKATKKIAIENKWINEVPENTITETFYDEDYFNQIDCIIK